MSLAKHNVVAGLDPAIHFLASKMDARVKPAHDSGWCGNAARPRSPHHHGLTVGPQEYVR